MKTHRSVTRAVTHSAALFLAAGAIASSAPAQTRADLRTIQRTANEITVLATRLDAAVETLEGRSDVVPPIFLQRTLAAIDATLLEIGLRLDFVNGQTVYFRMAGVGEEVAELFSALKSAPTGNEISEIILSGESPDEHIHALSLSLDALRDAAPCIRREIQELDE